MHASDTHTFSLTLSCIWLDIHANSAFGRCLKGCYINVLLRYLEQKHIHYEHHCTGNSHVTRTNAALEMT